MMNEMKNKLPKNVSNSGEGSKKYIKTISDMMEPNRLELTKTYCDPHFFDPKGHMRHMKHMKLDDIVYIKHMIPHHQVAVNMSKVLLKNTKSDFMRHLAYIIIRIQQAEIMDGDVNVMVLDMLGGIRSTWIYVGASRLKELSKRTTFQNKIIITFLVHLY